VEISAFGKVSAFGWDLTEAPCGGKTQARPSVEVEPK
jgi:hypothetical protein